MCHRSVPPHNEIEQRQLPPEFHSGCDEAHQGEGGYDYHLRTDAGGWQYVLRIEGGEQTGGFQGSGAGYHRQPLRCVSG